MPYNAVFHDVVFLLSSEDEFFCRKSENAPRPFIRAMHDQKKKNQVPFVYYAVEQFLEAKFDPNGGKGNKQLSKKTLNELKSVGGIIVDNWKLFSLVSTNLLGR